MRLVCEYIARLTSPLAGGATIRFSDDSYGGQIGWREIALVLVLGLLCTAFAHTLFIMCLKRLTAHTASVIAALEPVYGILLAVFLLDEFPGWRTWAGAVLIVGAAMLATWHDSGAAAARAPG